MGTPAVDQKMPEVEDAIARFRAQDFAGAFKYLQDAVKKQSDLPPAQIIMAQLFFQANVAAGVRTWLDKAAFELPKDPQATSFSASCPARRPHYRSRPAVHQGEQLMTAFTGPKKRKEAMQPQILNGLASIAEVHEEWATAQETSRGLVET